jgi:membrane fusion protein, multidrug efflux system
MRRFHPLLWLGLALPLSLSAAPPAPPPAKVVVTQVREQELAPTTSLVGALDFDRISKVSGETSGRIMRQHAVEGALVKQGDPLVELNTDLIRKDMDIKQKQRAQANADLEKVARSMQRLENLLQSNSASRQAYDDARFEHQSLMKRRETVDEEISRLQIQLEKSTVRAPFDGVVLAKLREQGEWVNPGTPVAHIASTSDLVVKVAIPEKLMQFQTAGSEVAVTITALNQSINGKITGFIPVADIRSKSATLKIAIPWRRKLIRNMSAALEIPSGNKQTLRLLPRDAVVKFNGQNFVYTVAEGKAKMLPIRIVARTGADVAVAEPPVSAGMQLVVDGNDRLRPDQPVQIVKD